MKISRASSGCIIYSAIDHNINISKYIPKELDHPRTGLINVQNIEWFKCLVRYLNPADHDPARITKADKDLAKDLILKEYSLN